MAVASAARTHTHPLPAAPVQPSNTMQASAASGLRGACSSCAPSAPLSPAAPIAARAPRAAVQAAAAAAGPMPALAPQIMVNSMAGKMGQAVATATRGAGLELVPFTLCAPDVAAQGRHMEFAGQQIELVGPDARDEAIAAIKAAYPRLIMVDYTVPDVIHEQAEFYIRHRTPFVMVRRATRRGAGRGGAGR